MSHIFRLTNRVFANGPKLLLKNEHASLLNFVRPVVIQSKKPAGCRQESYDEKNMKLKRPQSPHLTIYAPQVTSMLSISHRGTGLILAGYVMSLGLAAIALPCPIEVYLDNWNCSGVNSALLSAVKFSIAFPMSYHFWNGIRHLLWDTGKFLSLKEVYLTGYVMLAVSIASAIGLTLM